jgi:Glyoxalase-like domain
MVAMSVSWQLTIDSANPAELGRFWATALGYVEDSPPEGYDDWPQFLTAAGVPEDQWDTAYAIVDPDGVRPRIYLQKVREEKRGKNRLHLDVPATPGPQMPLAERRRLQYAARDRLVALGATQIEVFTEADSGWIIMQDPEGNEFCIT